MVFGVTHGLYFPQHPPHIQHGIQQIASNESRAHADKVRQHVISLFSTRTIMDIYLIAEFGCGDVIIKINYFFKISNF